MYNSCWTTFMALSCIFKLQSHWSTLASMFGEWHEGESMIYLQNYHIFNLGRSTQAKGTVCPSSSFVSSWGQAWNTLLNQPYNEGITRHTVQMPVWKFNNPSEPAVTGFISSTLCPWFLSFYSSLPNRRSRCYIYIYIYKYCKTLQSSIMSVYIKSSWYI